jgi:hypothetical protein
MTPTTRGGGRRHGGDEKGPRAAEPYQGVVSDGAERHAGGGTVVEEVCEGRGHGGEIAVCGRALVGKKRRG